MDWKQQFNKANTKIKEGIKQKNAENLETAKKAGERVKGDIKQKAKDKINLEKNKIINSSVGRFAQEKGFKNKAKFVGKGALNKFKGTNLYRNITKAINAIDKVVQFVAANFVPILIITCVIVVGTNLTIAGIGVFQAIGETPHYYCYTNPPAEIKNSAAYKQYCENDVSSIQMKGLNGHYVVQDGPGPCTSCSMLNMIIRFYYSQNINIFDFLWQGNGQYSPLGNSLDTGNDKAYNFRLFLTGYEAANKTEDWAADIPTNGSRQFAASHGKSDYTMANWGYLRDASVEVGSDAYLDLSNNENWVWDLSLENDGPGSDWTCMWGSGNKVTIEGVTATVVYNDAATNPIRDKDHFQYLLDAHPAGIVVFRKYGTGKNHAILVTGYKKQSDGSPEYDANGNLQFTAVDPARKLLGGYEVPVKDCAKGVVDGKQTIIFDNSILNNPATSDIICYVYLDEG